MAGKAKMVKNTLDVVSVALFVMEMVIPLFFINSSHHVGRVPIGMFIFLVNAIPFMFAFFYIMFRCVKAAERVFGIESVRRFNRRMRGSLWFLIIFIFFLMFVVPFDPHFVQIGFFYIIVVSMTIFYAITRVIEWRRAAMK